MELAMALPEQVIHRLEQSDADVLGRSVAGFTVSKRGALIESRVITRKVELRAGVDETTFGLEGYAAVWDVWYEVLGGPPWGWSERVLRASVVPALADGQDIRFLVDHAGIPLARTRSGTATVDHDELGLRTDVPGIDLRNPKAQEVRSAVDRGDIDQMSWAFRVSSQEWNEDYTERTITGVKRIYDVSLVTFPANPATAMGRKEPKAPAKRSGSGLALARAQLELLDA
jgi:HK97 family phage prohead protease